jgi:hypothetical protein
LPNGFLGKHLLPLDLVISAQKCMALLRHRRRSPPQPTPSLHTVLHELLRGAEDTVSLVDFFNDTPRLIVLITELVQDSGPFVQVLLDPVPEVVSTTPACMPDELLGGLIQPGTQHDEA